jgi:hypothetical protein
MRKFNGGFFYTVARIYESLARDEVYDGNDKFDEDIKKTWCDNLRILITSLKEAELNLSVIATEDIIDDLERGSIKTHYDLAARVPNLQDRIRDELSLSLFMQIPYSKASYYEDTYLFGEDVFNKFPSANLDIEEAGKCFATARYTACVMHLQRVLEIGLKSYANCLGVMNLITTAQPSWQNVLDKTAKEIKDRNDKQNTTANWTSNEEKDFCENVQPFLVSVKTAWRNPSMHADKTYNEEIAEDIYSAVKRFMKHLAEHLDEKGKFRKRKKK